MVAVDFIAVSLRPNVLPNGGPQSTETRETLFISTKTVYLAMRRRAEQMITLSISRCLN